MVQYIKSDLISFSRRSRSPRRTRFTSGPVPAPRVSPCSGRTVRFRPTTFWVRMVDGTYNNLLHPQLGASDNEFPEPLGTQFRTIMVDPAGPGALVVPVSYTPGVDNDGPGSAVWRCVRSVCPHDLERDRRSVAGQSVFDPHRVRQRAGIAAPGQYGGDGTDFGGLRVSLRCSGRWRCRSGERRGAGLGFGELDQSGSSGRRGGRRGRPGDAEDGLVGGRRRSLSNCLGPTASSSTASTS